METKKQNLLLCIKDWRFWFKIALAALIIFSVTYDYVDGMLKLSEPNKKGEMGSWAIKIAHYIKGENGSDALSFTQQYDYAGFTFFYFTYFTIQSNLFVALWCIIAACQHLKEGNTKITKSIIAYSVATYITITGLIYNFMLFPLAFIKDADGVMPVSNFKPMTWISQQSLHTISPITFVLYTVLFRTRGELIEQKTLLKTKWWVPFTYPVIWGVGDLLRGEMYYRSGRPSEIQYHYFFMHIHQNGGTEGYPIKGLKLPGVAWFIIAIGIIAAISFGFFVLYSYASLKIVKKNATKTEVSSN